MPGQYDIPDGPASYSSTTREHRSAGARWIWVDGSGMGISIVHESVQDPSQGNRRPVPIQLTVANRNLWDRDSHLSTELHQKDRFLQGRFCP